MVRHWGLAVLVLLSLVIQFVYRIPGSFLFILLSWVGLGFFVTITIGLFLDLTRILVPDLRLPGRLQRVWRWAQVPVLVCAGYSLVLLVNGLADRSTPAEEPWEVIRLEETDLDVAWRVPLSWVRLRSRSDQRAMWLLVRPNEVSRIWVGQHVLVHRHRGALGIPWISRIERDEEQYARQIIQAIPTAAEVWKTLVWFYLDHQRWQPAKEAVMQYLTIYPQDYDFAESVGATFGQARRHTDQIDILEPFLTRHPTYYGYTMVGFAYSHLRQFDRAIALHEEALRLDPDNYWTYYQLGYTYQWMGDRDRAIAMFEEVLKRRPDFPEIQAQLADLRQQASH